MKGVDTFTFTVMPQEEKSNLSFLFLHGAAFKAEDWLDLGTLHLMAALGYKTVAADLPGESHYNKILQSIFNIVII